MKKLLVNELRLRLKAPIIALERIVQRKYLSRIFAEAALSELKKIRRLVSK